LGWRATRPPWRQGDGRGTGRDGRFDDGLWRGGPLSLIYAESRGLSPRASQSGRTEARIGLRMMPTSPRSPLFPGRAGAAVRICVGPSSCAVCLAKRHRREYRVGSHLDRSQCERQLPSAYPQELLTQVLFGCGLRTMGSPPFSTSIALGSSLARWPASRPPSPSRLLQDCAPVCRPCAPVPCGG
jgi:hypothetical protein